MPALPIGSVVESYTWDREFTDLSLLFRVLEQDTLTLLLITGLEDQFRGSVSFSKWSALIGCLRTHVRKQPIIALYYEFENELKFYNLEAWLAPKKTSQHYWLLNKLSSIIINANWS